MMEKNKRLQVVLTPAEWSAVRYLAKDTHLSWSSLVRFALAELARQRAQAAQSQAPDLAATPALGAYLRSDH